MKMKKKILIIFSIIVTILLIATVGGSYYIGLQVFEGSTQLVTPEETSEIKDSFWEKYKMTPNEIPDNYDIEEIKLTSSFDGHIIPGEYISAASMQSLFCPAGCIGKAV